VWTKIDVKTKVNASRGCESVLSASLSKST